MCDAVHRAMEYVCRSYLRSGLAHHLNEGRTPRTARNAVETDKCQRGTSLYYEPWACDVSVAHPTLPSNQIWKTPFCSFSRHGLGYPLFYPCLRLQSQGRNCALAPSSPRTILITMTTTPTNQPQNQPHTSSAGRHLQAARARPAEQAPPVPARQRRPTTPAPLHSTAAQSPG